MPTIDGVLTDWTTDTRLDNGVNGTVGYGLYGTTDADYFYFAITSLAAPIGQGTTVWLDTDLDRTSGYQIWGWTGGVEYHVEVGADDIPRLYSGGPGGVLIGELTYAYSADNGALEFRIDRALIGNPEQVRVFSDVNDTAFIPNSYATANFIVGTPSLPDPVAIGGKILDGALTDWDASTRLDSQATGQAGYAFHGDMQDNVLTFAISTDGVVIGAGTTIWLDTDVDRGTGYQIWGVTGGAEYNLNFGADGTLRLYSGAAGETLVGSVQYALSDDGTVLEVAIDASLIGSPESVRVLADVNDTVFIPNDYSTANFIVSSEPAVQVGTITMDGIIDAGEWGAADTLVSGDYSLLGQVQVTDTETQFVLAISSGLAPIGAETTIWLDTDMNTSTGHQIWGWAGGAEYNVNISADGTAQLFTGGAGEIFVADLTYSLAADGSGFEVAIATDAMAGSPQSIRVLADVNNNVFLPGAYAGANLVVSAPQAVAVDDPQLRIGIVYSETTAQNYYSITNYGQLFMSAQNQAMQAGIPFDLLTEADLLDPANLAVYDAIVFPSFSHVEASQVDAIAASLAVAASDYGVGLIAAGNFMTNDETGAALPGNSYVHMQTLLGVTLEGYGATTGIGVEATASTHPILDGYEAGQAVGDYVNTSYLYFTDATQDSNGQVLFDQVVNDASGGTVRVDGVIATTTDARNVHFASDALIGNSNVLSSAIDWVATDNAPNVSLLLTRDSSLFYARNDMDQAMEIYDVVDLDPGIYDVMLPIVDTWYQDYGFVGSYYIDIGAAPPDQNTDWSVSSVYYQQLLGLESEIGSHSYTHPEDTNLLTADTPEILALVALVDPRNPNAVAPWTLTAAEQSVLFNSFRFQFETSRLIIEENLGVAIAGAAVPGAPENLDATREMIQYYDYLSGGYSGAGAGYPGAFGYLTPAETEQVYLAPNISFDFSLIGFQGLTPEQAAAVWLEEYAQITGNATTPIIAFPWHDYGPTLFDTDNTYHLEMYQAIIATAHADGTEFVTGADLADRIDSFANSTLVTSQSGNVITAQVSGDDLGHFALDVSDEGSIASVDGYYAYNDHAVFVPQNGGTFAITLGETPADVTHISQLAQRADLIFVSGDGTDLDFAFSGRGETHIHLTTQGTQHITVAGANGGHLDVNGNLVLAFDAVSQHTVALDYSSNTGPLSGSAGEEILIGGSANDIIAGNAGDDVLIGNAGNDVLDGGEGSDTLSGGTGNADDLTLGYDTFVFTQGGGHDIILDFTTNIDTLQFSGLGFVDAADAYGQFNQTADGLLLSFGTGNSVLLSGLTPSELAVSDILVDPEQLV